VYSGPVIHTLNANQNCTILSSLTGPSREEYISQVKTAQETLRRRYAASGRGDITVSYHQALEMRHRKSEASSSAALLVPQVVRFSVEELEPLIDWDFFYRSWGMNSGAKYKHLRGCSCPECLGLFEARDKLSKRLRKDASEMLRRFADEGLPEVKGVVGVFPAVSDGENIRISAPDGAEWLLPMLRSQKGECRSLCDYVVEPMSGTSGKDAVGCFCVSAGIGLEDFIAGCSDRYEAMMAKFMADRLAEAAAVLVQKRYYGAGLRAAFGYSSCPDHSLKRLLFELLGVKSLTSLRLNDHYMIEPAESVCGLILPEGKYFDVGKVDDEQMSSYAARLGFTVDAIKKLIPNNI